jgi:adenylate kinase
MANVYIFVGRSGSGKGTQGALLDAAIRTLSGNDSLLYLETGRLVRDFSKGDTESSLMSKAINDVGGLQPEFLIISLWSNFLIKNFKKNMHVITDGTPRKLLEAKVLDSALDFYNFQHKFVIFLNASNDEVTKRLLARDRADDTLEGIHSRLAWYETEVAPVVDFYRTNSKYIFCDINADQSAEKVQEDLRKAVGL